MARTPQHLSRLIAFNPSSRPASANRRALLTAALALAVMAATLLPTGPAQARDFWSATLTVDKNQTSYGCNNHDATDNCSTVLSDDDFEYKGNTYKITRLYWDVVQNRLTLGFSGGATATALAGLKLRVDGLSDTLPFASTNVLSGFPEVFRWFSISLGWADGQRVRLSITDSVTRYGVEVSGFEVGPGEKDGELKVSWRARKRGGGSCGYRLEYRRAAGADAWRVAEDFYSYNTRLTRTLSSRSYMKPGTEYEVRLLVRPPLRTQQPVEVAMDKATTPGTAPGQQSTRGDVGVVEAPPLPALSVADAGAAEGGTLSFAVTLSEAASGPVTVDWTTADGTATAGADYEAATGALTFAAGETAKTVTVATLADTAQEETETLTLTLSNPSGATLADAGATGSITDVAPPQQREPDPQTGERSGEAETEVVETPPLPALTARIVAAPSEHGGKGKAFNVRVGFSAAVTVGATKAVRAGTVQVGNGRVTRSTRVDGQRDLWEFRIKPGSHGDVTVTLAEADCGAAGAICTKDGRKLSSALALTVSSPASLAVADARAREGTDATIAFAVTLSRAAADAVTVRYVTKNGTATAGADYRRAKGTLTFAAGETAQTVSVKLLDDVHDEGEETFTLLLRKASGAVLADGKAVGTIENADPLQRAWLARFGRTVATHVTDAVGARLRGTPGQDSHLTIGGYRVPLGQPAGRDAKREGGPPGVGAAPDPEASTAALLHGLAGVLGLGPGSATPAAAWRAPSGPDPRLGQGRRLPAVRLRDVLQGSAFRLNLSGAAADAATPRLTAWGRFAGTTFDGREGALTLDGDVFTGTVGVDGAWDRVLVGVAVAHSRGDGGFTMPGTEERGQGDLEQTLTSLHPYLRYAVTDRLDVWGLVGYGWGEVDLELATGETLETDTTLVMGAFGGRGILLTPGDTGGFQLATRTDAMLTRTSSDTVTGLDGTDADAHRVRLILEGSRGFTWADGRSLTPTAELGVRHDWGDAETGFGLEVGGRVQYADPALGLTVEGAVRGLLAHEDADYEEWGASGTVRLAPGLGGQGLSLTLAPTWGAAASGIDGLWARQTTAGLASPGRTQAPGGRLTAEIGYGLPAFDTGLLTPYAGTVVSDGAARTYRVGARWASVTGLALTLEGQRQESPGQQPVNQGLQLQLGWGF